MLHDGLQANDAQNGGYPRVTDDERKLPSSAHTI